MTAAPDPGSLPLRDIHLPDAVSWWPPAPGWWLLLGLVALLVFAAFRRWRRGRGRRVAVCRARRELAAIRQAFRLRPDRAGLVKALSALLRRLAMSLYGRRDAAALTGEDWLAFLDQKAGGHAFTQGAGRDLIEAPYRADPEYDHAALLRLVSGWIDKAAAGRGRRHAGI